MGKTRKQLPMFPENQSSAENGCARSAETLAGDLRFARRHGVNDEMNARISRSFAHHRAIIRAI